jgi:hypothetical protein
MVGRSAERAPRKAFRNRKKRFQVLVAANLCAVIARELRAGEEPLREDLALFRSLLETGAAEPGDATELRAATRAAERELAAAIRSGAFDARLGELAALLQAHVRRKLAVARPGYDRDLD